MIGASGLKRELTNQGFTVISAPLLTSPEFNENDFMEMTKNIPVIDGVVVGFDSSFNYHKLCFASLALQKNKTAFLCATNEDAYLKLGEFAMPGNGIDC